MPENIAYRASSVDATIATIENGAGIGLISTWACKDRPNLIMLNGDWPTWDTKLWLVTHYMMHRTARVQAFNQFIKQKTNTMVV